MGRRITVSALGRMRPNDRRRKVALGLAACKGNVKRAAHFLGIHRSHLYRLINEHGLYPVVLEARRRSAIDADKARRLHRYGVPTE